ncbi:hypothetical protein AURDEDRAFT_164978 [Auricularia subglabra TFB-10046 SS5]|nr:hypothetical protein AURDEDRAFT_164978 [Auricularia subglabra TFB-10046 SS5]
MPVAAFTLGSFGDIASILQLVWQLRAALLDAARASAEVTALTADLDEFARALLELKAVLERRQKELQPGVVNGVAYALERCVQLLQTAQHRIGAFRARMVKAAGATAWRQYWKAAAWSILGGKAEMESLRARLFEQVDVIRVYFAVSQCNDQAVLHEAMQRQRASIDRLYDVMKDIQARFDVGIPSFHFSGTRRGRSYVYQPCARTSFQRFWNFCHAYMGDDIWDHCHVDKRTALSHARSVQRMDVEPTVDTLLTTWRLYGQGQLSECINGPVLDFQCLWFRESAFGEWQALIGVPSGRIDTQRLLKTLLERRHDIGAPCNCDAGKCRMRFADGIAESRLRMTLAESYTTAANTIIKSIDHSGTLATDIDSEIARLFRARPDPVYVRERVIPKLRECESEFDMFRLLEDAPKLSGTAREWASNFWMGPLCNPLLDPGSPWVFSFGHEDSDFVLPLLI